MADEKKKPLPAPEAGSSPFADDSDWDSELAAWDAALPIAEPPRTNGHSEPAQAPRLVTPEPAAEPPPALTDQPDPVLAAVVVAPDAESVAPPDAESVAPPDAESINFEPDEVEPVPPSPVTPPPVVRGAAIEDSDLFPPFALADAEEKTDVTDPEPLSLDDALEIVEDDGAGKLTPPPVGEGSGLLVIPDVDELAAMRTPATAQRSNEPAARPEAAAPSEDTGTRLRSLTEDGLPELSGLFTVDKVLGPEPELAGDGGPEVNPFEAEPPPEPPAVLDLSFPDGPGAWSAQQIASTLAAAAPTAGPEFLDRHTFREQLAWCTDELAAVREAGGTPEEVVACGLAAARAAEQAGQREAALRLYEEMSAIDPQSLAALRGQLRLRDPAVRSQGRALLSALAHAPGPERAAYGGLMAECAEATAEAPAGIGGDSQTGEVVPAAVAGLPGPGRAFAAAERALRAGNNGDAAERLAEVGRSLSGQAGASLLIEAARLQELAGKPESAASLRSLAQDHHLDEEGVALAALRAAVNLPPAEALPVLEDAAETLAGAALQGAVLRWAARLARLSGDPARSRALLARVARLSGTAPAALPERDRLDIAGEGDEESMRWLSLEGRVLLALRRAALHRKRNAPAEALAAVRAALADNPSAVPLALVAEEIGKDVSDPVLRDSAWMVWAEADPARRAHAHHLRAQQLADNGDGVAARRALEEAASSLADSSSDPVFWELAWANLRSGDRPAAAAALEAGIRRWRGVSGAEPLVAVLEERLAELRRAANPAEALGAAPSFGGEGASDDPVALTNRMLDGQTAPAAVAALLTAESPHGLTHRALEAAGWMVQAGAGREALAWLLDRRQQDPDAPLSPAVAAVLRRLARLYADPAARPQLLAQLSASGGGEVERQAMELQRAEFVEAAGDRTAAAQMYRALLGGPFASDAELALRRVLWSDRDAKSLVAVYRAESEAAASGGEPAAAATAQIEEAQVHADLENDSGAAHQALAGARTHDPSSAEARFALLAEAVRAGRFPEAAALLEESATRDFPSTSASLLSLTALLDEARAGGRQSTRLLRAALSAAEAPAPLNVLVRLLAAESTQSLTSAAVAGMSETLARTLSELEGSDSRAVATLLVRAAEIRETTDPDLAENLLRQALDSDPECVPALVRLRRLLTTRARWKDVVAMAETEAASLRKPEHQAQALLRGAAVAETELHDSRRAASLLRGVLDMDPAHPEAFERMRQLLEKQGDPAGVAELLELKVRAASDPAQVASIRLERAALLADTLNDRGAAKDELRVLIGQQPQNVEALSQLAALELDDGAYAVAAELYIRQARFDRDPQRLREIFLCIGRIYLRRLPDVKLATGAFERVLRLDAENREALEALSELYGKQGEARKALAVTEPLIERETDPQKRLPFLLRIASLWEKLGDPRRAGVWLKRAAEECPRSLQAVGELARFYERTKETVARNVLLDGSIGLLREDLRRDPRDVGALRAIIPLLRWRQRHACSAAAAQLLAVFSNDEAERAEVAGWAAPPLHGRRLTPLANPELEDLVMPAALPPGVRNILRLCGPALAKAWRPNLKRWEVGRSDRQGSGTPARSISDTVAVDLGVRGFDLYVSAVQSRAIAVEPGDPPALILGSEIAGLGPASLRFACAYTLRLVSTHLDLLAQGTPVDAGVLLAALVVQFIPDYRHPDLSEAEVAGASQRVSRILSKAQRTEVAPFAAEIAVPFPLDGLLFAVEEAAARVGLLASGDLAASLRTLMAVSGRPLTPEALAEVPTAQALLDFALSDAHEELVATLDAVA
jgi:tetratricopeptide (TPR) repeat protein